jgi:hypothetical protein
MIFNEACSLNDRGKIAGTVTLPNGESQNFLLVPCDEHHRGVEGCGYSVMEGSTTATQTGPAVRDSPTKRERRKRRRGDTP